MPAISHRAWVRVTRAERCPVCAKRDWCVTSPDRLVVVCMREPSSKPAKAGGWLHDLRPSSGRRESGGGRVVPGVPRSIVLTPDRPTVAPARWAMLDRQCRADLTDARAEALASSLGVSSDSLRRLGLGWHVRRSLYTFPMHDVEGRITGLRTRHPTSGEKRCVTGSRLGLVVPTPGALDAGWLVFTEGESDAAALLDFGFHAIARPGCSTCVEHVVAYVRRHRPARVAIVADADAPGQRGAAALARCIAGTGRRVRVLTMPDGAKDVRAWARLPCSSPHDLLALLDAAPGRIVRSSK